MEIDMNPAHWDEKACPKYDCRKNKCKCGLKYVFIPTALTEDMKPERGLYCNSIVEYEKTGEVWIFSTEGIPVLIRSGNGS